ncbi:MAG: hypothetical protein ACK4SJ_01025 [Sphingorhabdus sp.]
MDQDVSSNTVQPLTMPATELLAIAAGFDGFVGNAGKILEMGQLRLLARCRSKIRHRRYERFGVAIGQPDHKREKHRGETERSDGDQGCIGRHSFFPPEQKTILSSEETYRQCWLTSCREAGLNKN